MDTLHPYEKSRLRDRTREIVTLALFTVAVALISTVVMNILVYPVTLFAIHRKEIFNVIIIHLSLYGVIGLLAFLLVKKIYRLRRDGLAAAKISSYLLRRPAYYLGIFLVFLAVSSVIIAFLYLLFSYNYYYLFKLTNI
ncbi:MAG: hypothetical protein JW838_03090 [Spirochaetes bacterium]|nr:hypothetical protein [Spirochaetota bacterium]